MGLENLKSIFNNIENTDFQTREFPNSVHDVVKDNYPEGTIPPGPGSNLDNLYLSNYQPSIFPSSIHDIIENNYPEGSLPPGPGSNLDNIHLSTYSPIEAQTYGNSIYSLYSITSGVGTPTDDNPYSDPDTAVDMYYPSETIWSAMPPFLAEQGLYTPSTFLNTIFDTWEASVQSANDNPYANESNYFYPERPVGTRGPGYVPRIRNWSEFGHNTSNTDYEYPLGGVTDTYFDDELNFDPETEPYNVSLVDMYSNLMVRGQAPTLGTDFIPTLIDPDTNMYSLGSIFTDDVDAIDDNPLATSTSAVPVAGSGGDYMPLLDVGQIPSLPNFSPAGIDTVYLDGTPISDPNDLAEAFANLVPDLVDSDGWQSLYNADHSPKPIDDTSTSPYKPKAHINRDNLNIRDRSSGGDKWSFNPSRDSSGKNNVINELLKVIEGFEDTEAGGEPYVISRIPTSSTDMSSGREINKGNRTIPFFRAQTDTSRLLKYLSSAAGSQFMIEQNIPGAIRHAVVQSQTTDGRPGDKLIKTPQRFMRWYNPMSTILATSSRMIGIGVPNVLYRRDDGVISMLFDSLDHPFTPRYGVVGSGGGDGFSRHGYLPEFSINNTFTQHKDDDINPIDQFLNDTMFANFDVGTDVGSTGDKMTLAKMIKGNHLNTGTEGKTYAYAGTDSEEISVNVDARKEGMPLYFKDLRDNTYIFFRAYIEGLIENIVPSWNTHKYIGRSSPVYSYNMTERDVGFTLKLFANTESELDMIYKKLDRLTSMCYPEYVTDDRLSVTNAKQQPMRENNRMKPPLVKLRVGELYGRRDNELLGFIQTINYTIPQEAPWETEAGKRVPKFILATISYRVIHSEVPSINSVFYGINQKKLDQPTIV